MPHTYVIVIVKVLLISVILFVIAVVIAEYCVVIKLELVVLQ